MNRWFGFKGVTGDAFKQQMETGASDQEMVRWLDQNGTLRSPEEVRYWSDSAEANRPYDDPERREWFAEQCRPLGLDPAKTTLFDLLEADDKASF